MWRRAVWPVIFLPDKIMEYFKSFWMKDKKTSAQENDIPLGRTHGRGHSSTSKFDDAMLEEDAIGG